MGRVFVNGPGDLGSIPGCVILKTLKWYLIILCLNTQQYKVHIEGKWSNPGKGVAPSPTLWCCSYWKESLWVAFDYGHQLYLTWTLISVYTFYTPNVNFLHNSRWITFPTQSCLDLYCFCASCCIWMYSYCCCSCSQSSHKMYSNNSEFSRVYYSFQCLYKKMSGNLLKAPCIYIYRERERERERVREREEVNEYKFLL